MTPTEFMRAYEAALVAHDLRGALDLVDASAVYFFSNMTSHIGKPAIRAAIGANFDAIQMEQFEIRDLTWLVETEDVAACVYAFRWTGEIDGRPAAGSGRGTSVLRREGDSWRVVHEHFSQGPFKAQARG